MFQRNTILGYPVLLIKSIGEYSFSALGRLIKMSGSTASRMLFPHTESFVFLEQLSLQMLSSAKILYLTIDETMIRKIFSENMVGAGMFFDTKIGRRVMAYKLFIAAISDGKSIIPFRCRFIFAKELLKDPTESRDQMAQQMILFAQKMFPNKNIIVLADGAFATKTFLAWCHTHKISTEMRFHSNRKVLYLGQQIVIRDIKTLQPRGRQMARTIGVVWHGIPLHITAQRRIDKKGHETVVFQVATYFAKPLEHVKNYKTRWPIEKTIRTCKQLLGLGNCFSTKLETQLNHVAAVFCAFSFAQYEMQQSGFDTTEKALRALNRKSVSSLNQRFSRLQQDFSAFCA